MHVKHPLTRTTPSGTPRQCAVGTFHACLKIKDGPQMVDLRFDY